MARYRSEFVDSMHKDMGRVERAYFAQSVTLAKLCRLLQAEVGDTQNLGEQDIDQLEDAFRTAQSAIVSVNRPSYDRVKVRQNFINAEGKLIDLQAQMEPEWKAEVALQMRKARERDSAAQHRLEKVSPTQKLRNRPNVQVNINICDTRMDQAEEKRKIRTSSGDSLDGLLFLLAPPGHPRHGHTHLTYHPHFYAQPTPSRARYSLLQPWTTIGSLPSTHTLHLAHNKNKLPFLLLPQETIYLNKIDILVTDLNSSLPSRCQLEVRETGESVFRLEDSWDRYPSQDVREFQELDWKVVVNSQPPPSPPPSLPSRPTTPVPPNNIVHVPIKVPPKTSLSSSNILIVSTVVVGVVVIAFRWFGTK